jgi:hypothetical protein
MSGRFTKGNDVNKAGKARHAGRLSSSDSGAPAPTPRSPRVRRFRRNRSLDHTAITEVHSKRPLQLVPLLRTTRRRLTRATPQNACQPHQPHLPGSHRRSSPHTILCTNAHGTHACTHSLQPTALWGRLPLRGVADSGEARCALSIRPLLGCAGHFLPSDPRRPARSCGQVRRVADPSSLPHAPRRVRCTRWPDELEGSALEMAHSDDDRSHSKGHDRSSRRSRTLQRPCDRLAAEQLAALVTGRAHCPVCGAHGTSVAQLEEPRYLWTV